MKYNLETLNNLWTKNKYKSFVATRFYLDKYDVERHMDYEVVAKTPCGQFAIRYIGAEKCRPGLIVGNKPTWYVGKAKKTYDQAWKEKDKRDLENAKKVLRGKKYTHLEVKLDTSSPKSLASTINSRLMLYDINKHILKVPLFSKKDSRKLKRTFNKWTDQKIKEVIRDINSYFQNERLISCELVKICPRIKDL